MRTFTVLLLSSLVCFPRAARACSVCYGAPDDVQTQSMNMAIFALLGVVATVLGLFAAFFAHLTIRAKTMAMLDSGAVETGQMELDQLVEVNTHE